MVEEVKMETRNGGDRERLSQHLSELKDKESEIRLQIKNLQEELSRVTEVAKGVEYSLQYLSSEESTVPPQHAATPVRSQKRKIDWIVEALEDGKPKSVSEIKSYMLANGHSGPTKNLSAMLNNVLKREQVRKTRAPICIPLERDGTRVWKLNPV